MKKLKNNKAVGVLGVGNEAFKYCEDHRLAEIIATCFEIMINTNVMPKSMNMGNLVTILKDIKAKEGSVMKSS